MLMEGINRIVLSVAVVFMLLIRFRGREWKIDSEIRKKEWKFIYVWCCFVSEFLDSERVHHLALLHRSLPLSRWVAEVKPKQLRMVETPNLHLT